MELCMRPTAESNVVAVVERLELGEPEPAAESAPAQPPHAVPRRTGEQRAVLPVITELVRSWRGEDGFVGAAVLASRDHNRVTVYSQFEAGHDAPAVVDHLGVPARTLDRRTFDLRWRDGNEDPSIVSLRHTPVVHFGLFTVLGDQSEALLGQVAASAPASLVTPGLRTINFHRSQDGQRLINVGTWSGFDGFTVLLDQPGFKTGKKYWEGLATFQNDYFDVVDVI